MGGAPAVLFTGGFHTATIAHSLKTKGISFVVVTPAVDRLDQDDLYVQSMTEPPHETVAPIAAFYQHTTGLFGDLLAWATKRSASADHKAIPFLPEGRADGLTFLQRLVRRGMQLAAAGFAFAVLVGQTTKAATFDLAAKTFTPGSGEGLLNVGKQFAEKYHTKLSLQEMLKANPGIKAPAYVIQKIAYHLPDSAIPQVPHAPQVSLPPPGAAAVPHVAIQPIHDFWTGLSHAGQWMGQHEVLLIALVGVLALAAIAYRYRAQIRAAASQVAQRVPAFRHQPILKPIAIAAGVLIAVPLLAALVHAIPVASLILGAHMAVGGIIVGIVYVAKERQVVAPTARRRFWAKIMPLLRRIGAIIYPAEVRPAQDVVEEVKTIRDALRARIQENHWNQDEVEAFLQARTETLSDRIQKRNPSPEEIQKEINGHFKSDHWTDAQAVVYRQARSEPLLREGDSLDDQLPEAYALVCVAAKYTQDKDPYDVQIEGAIEMSRGRIAQMNTGEGKTLTVTMPTYLRSLAGKGVHVITTNDYLVRTNAEDNRPLYAMLGRRVDFIQEDSKADQRKKAYAADITYVKPSELVFDYLRDQVASSVGARVHRYLANQPVVRGIRRMFHFFILDEVDSILLDEAISPYILSGMPENEAEAKAKFLLASLMVEKVRAARPGAVRYVTPEMEAEAKEKNINLGDGYLVVVNARSKSAYLTDEGVALCESLMPAGFSLNPGASESHEWKALIDQSLQAHFLFHRGKDYTIDKRTGEVIIVDQFTGRLKIGSSWSDGIHQAIAAKERALIPRQSRTNAQISSPNFFSMYEEGCGTTGTAKEDEGEFKETYGLRVAVVRPNRPSRLFAQDDMLYRTKDEQLDAVAESIIARHRTGQPVLIGTSSIAESNELERRLFAKFAELRLALPDRGIFVLNAENAEDEAKIVARAGQKGAITISTNMAGRGTDIKLGEGVEELGGLHVIGVGRNMSRRIDRQLAGRAGRQGQRGSFEFISSMEDELLRRYAPSALRFLTKNGGPFRGIVYDALIRQAQRAAQLESRAERRKSRDIDNDLRTHWEEFSAYHQSLIDGGNLDAVYDTLAEDAVAIALDEFASAEDPSLWNREGLLLWLDPFIGPDAVSQEWLLSGSMTSREAMHVELKRILSASIKSYRTSMNPDDFDVLVRKRLTGALDEMWTDYLQGLADLQQNIGSQGDPRRAMAEYNIRSAELYDLSLEKAHAQACLLIPHIKDALDHEPSLQQMVSTAKAESVAKGSAVPVVIRAARPRWRDVAREMGEESRRLLSWLRPDRKVVELCREIRWGEVWTSFKDGLVLVGVWFRIQTMLLRERWPSLKAWFKGILPWLKTLWPRFRDFVRAASEGRKDASETALQAEPDSPPESDILPAGRSAEADELFVFLKKVAEGMSLPMAFDIVEAARLEQPLTPFLTFLGIQTAGLSKEDLEVTARVVLMEAKAKTVDYRQNLIRKATGAVSLTQKLLEAAENVYVLAYGLFQKLRLLHRARLGREGLSQLAAEDDALAAAIQEGLEEFNLAIPPEDVIAYAPESLRTDEAVVHEASEALGNRVGKSWVLRWGLRPILRGLVILINWISREMSTLGLGSKRKPMTYKQLFGRRLSGLVAAVTLIGGAVTVGGVALVYLGIALVNLVAATGLALPILVVAALTIWGLFVLDKRWNAPGVRAGWKGRVVAKILLPLRVLSRVSRIWKKASSTQKTLLFFGSAASAFANVQGIVSEKQAENILFQEDYQKLKEYGQQSDNAAEALNNPNLKLTPAQKAKYQKQKAFAEFMKDQIMVKLELFRQHASQRLSEIRAKLPGTSGTERALLQLEMEDLLRKQDKLKIYDELATLGRQGSSRNSAEVYRLRVRLDQLNAQGQAAHMIQLKLNPAPEAKKDAAEYKAALEKKQYDDELFLKAFQELAGPGAAKLTLKEVLEIAGKVAAQNGQGNNVRGYIVAQAAELVNRQTGDMEDDFIHTQAMAALALEQAGLEERVQARELAQKGSAAPSSVQEADGKQLKDIEQKKSIRETVYDMIRTYKAPADAEQTDQLYRHVLDGLSARKVEIKGDAHRDSLDQLRAKNPELFKFLETVITAYAPLGRVQTSDADETKKKQIADAINRHAAEKAKAEAKGKGGPAATPPAPTAEQKAAAARQEQMDRVNRAAKVKPGDNNKQVNDLAKLLQFLGVDVPASPAGGNAEDDKAEMERVMRGDGSPMEKMRRINELAQKKNAPQESAARSFDGGIEMALRVYRAANGISEPELLGPKTLDAMRRDISNPNYDQKAQTARMAEVQKNQHKQLEAEMKARSKNLKEKAIGLYNGWTARWLKIAAWFSGTPAAAPESTGEFAWVDQLPVDLQIAATKDQVEKLQEALVRTGHTTSDSELIKGILSHHVRDGLESLIQKHSLSVERNGDGWPLWNADMASWLKADLEAAKKKEADEAEKAKGLAKQRAEEFRNATMRGVPDSAKVTPVAPPATRPIPAAVQIPLTEAEKEAARFPGRRG